VALSQTRYPDGERRRAFVDQVLDRLGRTPGVRHAGAISLLPLTGQTSDWTFGVEGYLPASGQAPAEQARVVAGDYFRALDIALLGGRLFTDADAINAPRVAIVSDLLARKYWPDGSPIGRRIRRWGLDSTEPWTTVVGVVADIRHTGLADAPVPFVYFPGRQLPESAMTIVARVDPADGAAVARGPMLIADAVRFVDPDQPIWSPRTMDEWLARTVSQPRFSLVLLTVFALVAVVLASVGVYSVMTFMVTRRTHELGVRLALGARPASLMRSVLREAATLAAIGILGGGAAALAAGRAFGAVFHDVRTSDPAVLAGVPLLVLSVALLASYLPARRAMRVDPLEALRSE
jgi:putative ABC transport system permease protein